MVKSPTLYFIDSPPAQREFKLTLTPQLKLKPNGVSLNHIIAVMGRALRLKKKAAGFVPRRLVVLNHRAISP
jgi:hypothetical protein